MRSKPYKILFSGEFPRSRNYGGSHTVNVELLSFLLKDQRFELKTVAPIFQGETPGELPFPVEFIPTPYWRSKSFSDLRARRPYVRAVLDKISEWQPNLVHVDAFQYLAYSIPSKIPRTLFLHGSIANTLNFSSIRHPYSFLMKLFEFRDEEKVIRNQNVKAIFINSEHSRNVLVHGHNVPPELQTKIRAFKLGYNIARLGSGPLGRNKPVLLFVGGVSNHKGQRNLVHILPKILKSVPNAKLVLVGKDAGDMEFCKKEVERLKLENSVVFNQSVSDQELGDIFRSANIYVSAATEGFGINQVEAMGMGLPLVAWDKGAIKELFINGEEGFLVRSDEEFAEKTIKLLQNGALRESMGKKAKKHAEETFSWDTLGKKVAETYIRILENWSNN